MSPARPAQKLEGIGYRPSTKRHRSKHFQGPIIQLGIEPCETNPEIFVAARR